MTDTYRGGYKKAILDILEMIVKRDDSHLNSKKKYKKFLSTYLILLLQNPQVMERELSNTEMASYVYQKIYDFIEYYLED